MVELDARGRRLRAALAAVLVRDKAPELRLLHQWLDSWMGIGLVVVGMSNLGFTVSLGEARRRPLDGHPRARLGAHLHGRQREGGGGSEALARAVMDATDAMR
jgi:hypothetical protein